MSRQSTIMASCAPVAAAIVLVACSGPNLEDSLRDARQSLAEEDTATATIYLRNALQADSGNVEARIMLAQIALDAGDLQVARSYLEGVRSSGAPESDYAILLAHTLNQLRATDDALGILDGLPVSLQQDGEYWLVRAEVLGAMGESASAQSALEEAGRMGAAATRLDLVRARLAAAGGETDAAMTLLDGVLAAEPVNPEALAIRGMLSVATAETARAEGDLERAAEIYIESLKPLRAAPLLMALVELRLSDQRTDSAAQAASTLQQILPGSPITDYALGQVAYQDQRYEDALAALRTASTQMPEDVRLQAMLGATQLALGNLGQAEQQVLSALSRQRDNSRLLGMLLEIRLQQERYDAAFEAVNMYPGALDARDVAQVSLVARAFLQRGRAEEAIPLLERALELSPNDQTLSLQLIEANLRAGRSDVAAAVLATGTGLGSDAELAASVAILLASMQENGIDAGREYAEGLTSNSPQDSTSHLTAAIYYQIVGEIEQALEAVEQSIALAGQNAPALVLRGSLQQRLGMIDAARSSLDEAIELAPESANALAARGMMAASEQDHLVAAEFFARAFATSGNWNYLANATVSRRFAGQADWSSEFSDWLEGQSDHADAWMFLAEQYRLDGQDRAAVAAYDRVLEFDQNNLAALNNAAWLEMESSGERALEYARQAAELAPDNGAVLDTLGWILVNRSRAEEGLIQLERATQLLPDAAEIQYHLAVAQAQTGNVDMARQTLDRVLSGAASETVLREAQQFRDSL